VSIKVVILYNFEHHYFFSLSKLLHAQYSMFFIVNSKYKDNFYD